MSCANATPFFYYCADFLAGNEADQALQLFLQHPVNWQQETFQIFGRQVLAPRRLAWFGDAGVNYRYTGIDHVAQGWPQWLHPLRQRVEDVASSSFNFLLVNDYRDGSQHMGWHKDNETGAAPLIASVSLGAQRPFLYRMDDGAASQRVVLEHGSLCLFDGQIRHRLPPARRVKHRRINLTFRQIGNAVAD